MAVPLSAATTGTSGNFTYSDDGTSITITGYPQNAVGAVEIPSTINGKPVTSIGNSAFYGCIGLTSVSIPSSVSSIGYDAFSGCTELSSVSIPSSVTSIGSQAFNKCASISVDAANPNYSSSDGVLFNKLQTTLVQFPGSKSGAYTIPGSVNSIGSVAFSGCIGLTSVSIPSSVSSIGYGAFSGCTGLTSVSIPSSVSSIGDYAFHGCTGLTSVLIPSSVTSINSRAFYGCTGLTSVSIPSSVTSIGYQAFYGCTGLVSFSVDAANSNYSSSDGVLFNKLQTSLIQYPAGKNGDYTIPSSVTSIEDYALYGCTGLSSVSIPSSVTNIGYFTLYGCTGLVSFSVDAANPNYSSSDGVLFNKPQTSLIQYPAGKSGAYTIPSSVTSIGNSAFTGCIGLTSVSIPSSVTSIGFVAFGECTELTSVSIPPSVTSIGSSAFYGCLKLTSAIFMGNAPTLGSYAFAQAASGFTVYYLNGSSGFTSPTWQGYPTQIILTQTITFGSLSDKTYGNAPFILNATASSGLTPTFSIVSGPATISGNTVTLTGVGTVTVRASQAGSAGYLAAATVDQSFIVITALQSWRQTYFSTTANTGTAADSAVSNLDGLPNLVEYALGGTPTVANSAIPPKPGTVTSNEATYLTLTFTPQRPDITYAIEVTGDLTGAWTSIPLAGLLTMGQAYTYTDTIAVAASAPRFIRLRVSGQ